MSDKIMFSSGRTVYAYGRVIGLSLDDPSKPTYGSDGDLGEYDGNSWTIDDKRELAQMMINRWQEYLKSLS